MYNRMNDPDTTSLVPPARRIDTDAEHVHRALYARSGEIRTDMPGAYVTEELQDQEPRGILRIMVAGNLARVEFFESAFSADQLRFQEEYVQAARECGNIAILYPGQSFPEEYVLKKVEAVFDRARAAGVKRDLEVHGFLYEYDGRPREVV